ncbi:tRNA pseudouridine(38/39) synthase [Bacillus rossius redtenbacheri]|uniref:tRNA pseudouridine(38/39) synthase n=1 Tax=Bacillus rossius redtenbacheri TaxID=93214 RepID=UPI002FDEAE13
MANVRLKKMKKNESSREDLEICSKQELIDKVLKLEAHVAQLKCVLGKNGREESQSATSKHKRPFDFTKCSQRHVFLKLLYLGWDYRGLACQEDSQRTVEHHLFAALAKTCLVRSRETSSYHRCGRTDKGVSAFCQVVSLDVRSCLSAAELESSPATVRGELPYARMLNRVLPKDIRVLAWCPVPAGASARFDCKLRTYKYFFPRGNLDIQAMNTAAQCVVGTHDFRNLCKMDVANGVVTFTRRVLSAQVHVRHSDSLHSSSKSGSGYDLCELTLVGQAFLWHQVRCIMGILLLVGEGKEQPEIIKQLLDVENYPRKPQYCLASDFPLNLFHCEFEHSDWCVDSQNIAEVITTLQSVWTNLSVRATMVRAMLTECEAMTEDGPIASQSSSLLQGVKAKVYQPLLQRQTCDSLESRINHYVKKQKLEIVEENSENKTSEVRTAT